jgi:hypothetical protein
MQTFSLPSTWEDLLAKIKISHSICMERAKILVDFRIQDGFKNQELEIRKLSSTLETRFNALEDDKSSMTHSPKRRSNADSSHRTNDS